MQATQTRTTPLSEARQLRADIWEDMRRLRTEWPRREGWEKAMRLTVLSWNAANATVEWLEGDR